MSTAFQSIIILQYSHAGFVQLKRLIYMMSFGGLLGWNMRTWACLVEEIRWCLPMCKEASIRMETPGNSLVPSASYMTRPEWLSPFTSQGGGGGTLVVGSVPNVWKIHTSMGLMEINNWRGRGRRWGGRLSHKMALIFQLPSLEAPSETPCFHYLDWSLVWQTYESPEGRSKFKIEFWNLEFSTAFWISLLGFRIQTLYLRFLLTNIL